MSEAPTNNLKIAYSDDINPSTEQIELVKQSEAVPGNEEGQRYVLVKRSNKDISTM